VRRSISRALLALALTTGVASAAEDPRVLEVRREVDRIRAALPGLKMETVRLDDRSTDGGAATGTRDASGRIVHVRVEIWGESGKWLEELFFGADGALRFAFRERHRYNVPYYVNPALAKEMGTEPFDRRKTVVLEDRYYLENGRLFRWVDERKQVVDPGRPGFAKAQDELLALSAEVVQKLGAGRGIPAPAGKR
jgi:hypothetical protein